jgi:hypothetical protein
MIIGEPFWLPDFAHQTQVRVNHSLGTGLLSMPSVVFRSRLDGLVLTSLLAGAVVQVLVLVVLAIAVPRALFIVVPLLALTVGLVTWLYHATRYIVAENRLLIQGGIVSREIPFDQITRIEPTSNPASAPAWSLDRLLISYGQGKSCMISPVDKAAFLSLLRARGVAAA